MTGGAFARVLARLGDTLTLVDGTGRALGGGPALVQPLRERERQQVPTPLGRRDRERFLCLAHPALELESLGEGGYVTWQGAAYEVLRAQRVLAGRETVYRWALLRPREEE